jgi:hypothetical protein
MPKIITIPNDNDPVMNAERQRVPPWAATHGLTYTGYNNQADHLVQVGRAGGGLSLDALDFDCHGAPTVFNHTFLAGAEAFGRALSQITGFSANTAVYLDACNTGLTSAFGGPIAQAVANGARCTVYGTKGYMTGTFAEGNEECFIGTEFNPALPPYPGAQRASGRSVWIAYRPTHVRETDLKELRTMTVGLDPAGRVWAMFDPSGFREAPLSAASSITVRADSSDRTGLARALYAVMSGEPTEFPNLRMAPDTTINYETEEGVRILDVFANGGLVKDRVSGQTWRVSEPSELQTYLVQALG